MVHSQNKRRKVSTAGLEHLTESQLVIARASIEAEPASPEDPTIATLCAPSHFKPVHLSQQTPHPLDEVVTFEEDEHRYRIQYESNGSFCDDGVVSTSGFIHGFFGHFDADEVLRKMRRGRNFPTSKYANMTDEDIKRMWEENGRRASARGTLLHFLLESHMNGYDLENSIYAGLEDIQSYFRWRQTYFEPAGLVPFRTEMRFCTGPDLRLTGTADLLAIHKDHPPPCETGGVLQLHLIDWKFSRAIKSTNNYQCGSGPCAHLPDCNGVHYSLQQNLYKWFMETYYKKWTWCGMQYDSVKIVSMHLAIFHRNHGNHGLYMPLEDMSDVIHDMLNVRKEQVAHLPTYVPCTGAKVMNHPTWKESECANEDISERRSA